MLKGPPRAREVKLVEQFDLWPPHPHTTHTSLLNSVGPTCLSAVQLCSDCVLDGAVVTGDDILCDRMQLQIDSWFTSNLAICGSFMGYAVFSFLTTSSTSVNLGIAVQTLAQNLDHHSIQTCVQPKDYCYCIVTSSYKAGKWSRWFVSEDNSPITAVTSVMQWTALHVAGFFEKDLSSMHSKQDFTDCKYARW